MPMTLSNNHIITWLTQPERPKGAKDEVKEARRAAKKSGVGSWIELLLGFPISILCQERSTAAME